MNVLYVLGGLCLLAVGIFISAVQIKKIRADKAGQLGSAYKLLVGGVIFIMSGIALIDKYIWLLFPTFTPSGIKTRQTNDQRN